MLSVTRYMFSADLADRGLPLFSSITTASFSKKFSYHFAYPTLRRNISDVKNYSKLTSECRSIHETSEFSTLPETKTS